MTSVQTSDAGEDLKRLLQDRIAQLENGDAEPPKSADELAADETLEGASAAVRTVVADTSLSMDEKLKVLQTMYGDCISDVRALEYELGLEEKKLSVTELDYGELGEDLRKIDLLTEKLKTLSRELSKQNKAIMEESERRTAEERAKREEIVAKFDEAMRDIHAKLNSQEKSVDHRDELVESLELKLQQLQQQYDDREHIFQAQLTQDNRSDNEAHISLKEAEEECAADEESIQTEKKVLRELEHSGERLRKRVLENEQKMKSYEAGVRKKEEILKKHTADAEKLNKTLIELDKTRKSLLGEEEKQKAKSAEASDTARVLSAELDFWKGKLKSEREKRETLERLCRTLTEERTVMRKEVQAMQAAWVLLETEIENLRAEISADQDSSNTT